MRRGPLPAFPWKSVLRLKHANLTCKRQPCLSVLEQVGYLKPNAHKIHQQRQVSGGPSIAKLRPCRSSECFWPRGCLCCIRLLVLSGTMRDASKQGAAACVTKPNGIKRHGATKRVRKKGMPADLPMCAASCAPYLAPPIPEFIASG